MKPKFFEGNIVISKDDSSLLVVDRAEKREEGYVFYAVKGNGDFLSNPPRPFKENDLIRAPRSSIKKVLCLGSLFDEEENKFLDEICQAEISKIPLTQRITMAFYTYLSKMIFPIELAKDDQADDAYLAFLVKIIDKMALKLNVKSDAKGLYYSHLVSKVLDSPSSDQDWTKIKQLLEKASEEGDYSAYVGLGSIYLNKNQSGQMDEKKAYECFTKAIEGGSEDGMAALAVLKLKKSSKFYDPSSSYNLLSAIGMNGSGFGLYRSAKLIYDGLLEIKEPSIAYKLADKAYRQDIGEFLDGDLSLFIPEEAYLLSRMYREGKGTEQSDKKGLYYLLIALATFTMRIHKPSYLEEEDEIHSQMLASLKEYPIELLMSFKIDKMLDENRGFIDLLGRGDNLYLVDNIEQDKSQKFAKLVLTFEDNVVPYFDESGKIAICDKVILRLYGANKIKELSSRFYLGVDFALAINEGFGKVYLSFADEGNYGSFGAEADRMTCSFQKWNGPLKPLVGDLPFKPEKS
jgi:hypothetical protein